MIHESFMYDNHYILLLRQTYLYNGKCANFVETTCDCAWTMDDVQVQDEQIIYCADTATRDEIRTMKGLY